MIKQNFLLLIFILVSNFTHAQKKLGWLEGIPTEEVKRSRIELGYGTGIEYGTIGLHLDGHADIFFVNGPKDRVSLHNKLGLVSLAHLILYPYNYAALKYQRALAKSWLTLSVGSEVGYFYAFNDDDRYWTDPNIRIDLGYKIYKKSDKSVEFYLPLRVDKSGLQFNIGLLVMFSKGF